VEAPSWRRPPEEAERRRPEPGRPRLTAVGWAFLLAAVAALLTAGVAAFGFGEAGGLTTATERKFLGLLLGATVLLLVGVAAAVLRVLGVRFFRD
jgi:hypothetical protein